MPAPAPLSRSADFAAAAAILVALLLWEASGLDLAAARWFGNAGGFAWRQQWLTATLLHDGTRALAWVLALALAVNIRWPFTPRLTLRERIGWLLATLAGAALIPLIKQASLTSCPWDMAEFGGLAQAHYVPHWQWGVRDGGGGHCFPSGHASSAFAFLSARFALARAYPKAARIATWAVVAAGLLLGFVQLARGAHYPSHTLWTGWFCFCLNLMLARWLTGPASAPQDEAPPHPAAVPARPKPVV